ncbi:hypothetical protein AX16_002138 [Volvariella volvacea WC 439]|nr:hypothetical protein AX16_002138 [Volvariella volvacea WC 439]
MSLSPDTVHFATSFVSALTPYQGITEFYNKDIWSYVQFATASTLFALSDSPIFAGILGQVLIKAPAIMEDSYPQYMSLFWTPTNSTFPTPVYERLEVAQVPSTTLLLAAFLCFGLLCSSFTAFLLSVFDSSKPQSQARGHCACYFYVHVTLSPTPSTPPSSSPPGRPSGRGQGGGGDDSPQVDAVVGSDRRRDPGRLPSSGGGAPPPPPPPGGVAEDDDSPNGNSDRPLSPSGLFLIVYCLAATLHLLAYSSDTAGLRQRVIEWLGEVRSYLSEYLHDKAQRTILAATNSLAVDSFWAIYPERTGAQDAKVLVEVLDSLVPLGMEMQNVISKISDLRQLAIDPPPQTLLLPAAPNTQPAPMFDQSILEALLARASLTYSGMKAQWVKLQHAVVIVFGGLVLARRQWFQDEDRGLRLLEYVQEHNGAMLNDGQEERQGDQDDSMEEVMEEPSEEERQEGHQEQGSQMQQERAQEQNDQDDKTEDEDEEQFFTILGSLRNTCAAPLSSIRSSTSDSLQTPLMGSIFDDGHQKLVQVIDQRAQGLANSVRVQSASCLHCPVSQPPASSQEAREENQAGEVEQVRQREGPVAMIASDVANSSPLNSVGVDDLFVTASPFQDDFSKRARSPLLSHSLLRGEPRKHYSNTAAGSPSLFLGTNGLYQSIESRPSTPVRRTANDQEQTDYNEQHHLGPASINLFTHPRESTIREEASPMGLSQWFEPLQQEPIGPRRGDEKKARLKVSNHNHLQSPRSLSAEISPIIIDISTRNASQLKEPLGSGKNNRRSQSIPVREPGREVHLQLLLKRLHESTRRSTPSEVDALEQVQEFITTGGRNGVGEYNYPYQVPINTPDRTETQSDGIIGASRPTSSPANTSGQDEPDTQAPSTSLTVTKEQTQSLSDLMRMEIDRNLLGEGIPDLPSMNSDIFSQLQSESGQMSDYQLPSQTPITSPRIWAPKPVVFARPPPSPDVRSSLAPSPVPIPRLSDSELSFTESPLASGSEESDSDSSDAESQTSLGELERLQRSKLDRGLGLKLETNYEEQADHPSKPVAWTINKYARRRRSGKGVDDENAKLSAANLQALNDLNSHDGPLPQERGDPSFWSMSVNADASVNQERALVLSARRPRGVVDWAQIRNQERLGNEEKLDLGSPAAKVLPLCIKAAEPEVASRPKVSDPNWSTESNPNLSLELQVYQPKDTPRLPTILPTEMDESFDLEDVTKSLEKKVQDPGSIMNINLGLELKEYGMSTDKEDEVIAPKKLPTIRQQSYQEKARRLFDVALSEIERPEDKKSSINSPKEKRKTKEIDHANSHNLDEPTLSSRERPIPPTLASSSIHVRDTLSKESPNIRQSVEVDSVDQVCDSEDSFPLPTGRFGSLDHRPTPPGKGHTVTNKPRLDFSEKENIDWLKELRPLKTVHVDSSGKGGIKLVSNCDTPKRPRSYPKTGTPIDKKILSKEYRMKLEEDSLPEVRVQQSPKTKVRSPPRSPRSPKRKLSEFRLSTETTRQLEELLSAETLEKWRSMRMENARSESPSTPVNVKPTVGSYLSKDKLNVPVARAPVIQITPGTPAEVGGIVERPLDESLLHGGWSSQEESSPRKSKHKSRSRSRKEPLSTSIGLRPANTRTESLLANRESSSTESLSAIPRIPIPRLEFKRRSKEALPSTQTKTSPKLASPPRRPFTRIATAVNRSSRSLSPTERERAPRSSGISSRTSDNQGPSIRTSTRDKSENKPQVPPPTYSTRTRSATLASTSRRRL